MLTRRRPDWGYCLFFTIREYVLMASVNMPFWWYCTTCGFKGETQQTHTAVTTYGATNTRRTALARLKHTAYVRSMLIWSTKPFDSRCFCNSLSFLP